jgi:hypothetical protein
MSRHAAVQKPFVSPARALLTHWYSPIVTLFQPQLVSPTDLSCMQPPRLAGNNDPCFGSDTYGMLVSLEAYSLAYSQPTGRQAI